HSPDVAPGHSHRLQDPDLPGLVGHDHGERADDVEARDHHDEEDHEAIASFSSLSAPNMAAFWVCQSMNRKGKPSESAMRCPTMGARSGSLRRTSIPLTALPIPAKACAAERDITANWLSYWNIPVLKMPVTSYWKRRG